jgi:hypothetical protein
LSKQWLALVTRGSVLELRTKRHTQGPIHTGWLTHWA